ncbi:hypothetical protein BS50DRAFT_476531, partial [Corynespora cassiicola Philippines]
GRNRNRSRRGCWTCRSPQVKKRCDEQRPVCGNCSRRKLYCDYSPRPTLAERRRAEAAILRNSADSPISGIPNAVIARMQSPSLSVTRIATPSVGASSLTLTNEDHEAIRFFRTAFASTHHTKNPDYSMFSIMFTLAQDDPMVMHMVVSIGLREMDLRRTAPATSQRNPLTHYASALRLMADAISPENVAPDLDSIYTAIWLMLFYEQRFGDAECKAYSKHLDGASSLLQHRGRQLLQLPSPSCGLGEKEKAPVLFRRSGTSDSRLSIYAARILIWISLLDSAAASFGCGGQVNGTIYSLLVGEEESHARTLSPVEAFGRLHRFSNPLYRMTWGDNYPQTELLDDVENRNIYALLGQCAQLRFMVAQLSNLYRIDAQSAIQKARDVDASIQQVGYLFAELLEVASELSPATDNSHRLVANIRAIVPVYHAVVLDFMRATTFEQPLAARQRHAMREIMNLAYQSFKHDGDEAMIRVAWPLFMVALETDDLLHRDWILDRFTTMKKFGYNFERADRFLRRAIPEQQQLNKRIDVRARLESGE